MFDEVALSVVEILPVASVLREIDFFGGPERGLGLLVHLPDLRVVDREHAESVWGWGEKRLFCHGRHLVDNDDEIMVEM